MPNLAAVFASWEPDPAHHHADHRPHSAWCTALSEYQCSAPGTQVRVWDVRALKPMHSYFSRAPPTCLDISQRGLLAVGSQRRIQVRSPNNLHSHDLITGSLDKIACLQCGHGRPAVRQRSMPQPGLCTGLLTYF